MFVNATLDEVAGVADARRPRRCSSSTATRARVLRRGRAADGRRVIKAARVRSRADLQALEAFHTDFHLLDAHAAGLRGGTGETFDWELVRAPPREPPLILSGGLTAENVGDGIAAVAAVRGRRRQRRRGRARASRTRLSSRRSSPPVRAAVAAAGTGTR